MGGYAPDVRKGFAFPILIVVSLFALARLSRANAKKRKGGQPESRRLSAHQPAEPHEVVLESIRRQDRQTQLFDQNENSNP
jgi:hypothetical protein